MMRLGASSKYLPSKCRTPSRLVTTASDPYIMTECGALNMIFFIKLLDVLAISCSRPLLKPNLRQVQDSIQH
jgi:hypothetical protein